jgi:hypothetical protein
MNIAIHLACGPLIPDHVVIIFLLLMLAGFTAVIAFVYTLLSKSRRKSKKHKSSTPGTPQE